MRRTRSISRALCALALLAYGCSGGSTATNVPPTATPSVPTPSAGSLGSTSPASAPTTLATGLDVPWGLAFLPDGSAIVSERRSGRILRIPAGGGRPVTVMTVPDVSTVGEGGLLGLALSPSYANDRLVYAYVTTSQDNRIVRFTLGGAIEAILTGIHRAVNHNGGRIVFGPDGKLYAGTGDAGVRPDAQDRNSLNGKILRINPDGSVPTDNPFGNPVWSLGHRNVEGLVFDGSRLWATEFGQEAFDEVNLIERSHNYGWPVVEGTGSTDGGRLTNPKVTWPTSQASPSGAVVVGHRLYVAALRGTCLWSVPLTGATAGMPTRLLFQTFGRLRTVTVAPDGALWLMTSNRDGRGNPIGSDDRIIRYAI